MRRMIVGMAVVMAMVFGVGGAPPARAASGYLVQCGWGLAAIGANAFYMPAKLVYATLGGLTGGFAYLLTVGNGDAAQGILSPAIGGTYVLSAEMLQGDEPIFFSGESFE